jgi:HD-GYP domain-containing protein (c-di-GMP phosphodiesterase class II)
MLVGRSNPAHRLSVLLGYDGLSAGLLRYLLLVTLLGPLAVTLVALARFSRPSATEIGAAVILVGLATVAERFPLHLTHKTNINIAAGAYVVMLLLLPVWLPGLLALVSVGVAQALRRAEPMEALFNTSQTALYIVIGALTFTALDGAGFGPRIGELSSLGAIVVASTVMHLANTLLVALASSLQLGLNPLRVWWSTLALDLMPHVTLTALGTTAALLARDQPLVLLFLALQAALVHHAVRQTVQLRVDTHEALASLVEVMELRDPYTAGHSRRVANLSRALAERLGLTPQEADLIEQAGRVHDIGKAALDSAVLAKPDTLDDTEWGQMRMHPVHGANVVARFAAYRSGARIVRHHHEAWDGSGYPDQLAGDDIPLGARIIAVADTYDALTTNRPYRDALSPATALQVLQAGAGQQWDPNVVDALMTHLREHTAVQPASVPYEWLAAAPRGAVATVVAE